MSTPPEKCECGAEIVYLHGQRWCSSTLAKFRLLHGEPKPPSGDARG